MVHTNLFHRLAQGQMQQQNTEDAFTESQKPLARHIDDKDLDQMLREKERDGDPMAALMRKKKAKDSRLKGIKGLLHLVSLGLFHK